MNINAISYRQIIDNLYDGLYLVDRKRVITYWNRAAERITGFSAVETVGRSCAQAVLTHVDDEGNDLCRGTCPLAATMADGQPREAEVYLHHKDGHRIPVSVRTVPLRDAENHIVGGIELFSDISHSKANALRVKELEQIALLDHLTRLANRNYIEREMASRIEENQRFQMPFGILFMDIDHFKGFNDTYGHDVGDRVLRFIADTLVSNSRPFDLYGRWGGEEFLGLIRNIDGVGLEKAGGRMRMLVEKSYLAIEGGQKLHVTISIGATLFQPGDTAETLLKRADRLLYQSKKTGRNRLTAG